MQTQTEALGGPGAQFDGWEFVGAEFDMLVVVCEKVLDPGTDAWEVQVQKFGDQDV